MAQDLADMLVRVYMDEAARQTWDAMDQNLLVRLHDEIIAEIGGWTNERICAVGAACDAEKLRRITAHAHLLVEQDRAHLGMIGGEYDGAVN